MPAPTPISIIDEKQALRRALKAQRVAFAPPFASDAARDASEAVAAHLEGVVRFTDSQGQPACVALYAARADELDTAPIAVRARHQGSTTCYPRIVAKLPPRLSFHLVKSEGELGVKSYGIAEPDAEAPTPAAIDIFFVPSLGFDERGHRLGTGGGYYDAALRAQPNALRVGVGYLWQLLPSIPVEPHDELLDLVVTPRGCVVTQARSAHPLCQLVAQTEELAQRRPSWKEKST